MKYSSPIGRNIMCNSGDQNGNPHDKFNTDQIINGGVMQSNEILFSDWSKLGCKTQVSNWQ